MIIVADLVRLAGLRAFAAASMGDRVRGVARLHGGVQRHRRPIDLDHRHGEAVRQLALQRPTAASSTFRGRARRLEEFRVAVHATADRDTWLRSTAGFVMLADAHLSDEELGVFVS